MHVVSSMETQRLRVAGSEEGQDRLSRLADPLLVLILEKVALEDVRTAVRTSVLSRRWIRLPWLLSQLYLDVTTLCRSDGRHLQDMQDQASAVFAKALRSFLAEPRIITKLNLRFYLTKINYLHEIGRLVSEAVDSGMVWGVKFSILTDQSYAVNGDMEPFLRYGYGQRFVRFARAFPKVFGSLRMLSLRNLCFRDPSDLSNLVNTCNALESLDLNFCGFSSSDVLKIDAPRSRLRELLFVQCYMERIELAHVPKLVTVSCYRWLGSVASPIMFGYAPALEYVALQNRAASSQASFKLSEVLTNAKPVEDLLLGFGAGEIWVQPESPSQLGAAFSNLKQLGLTNIIHDYDLSRTMFLLEAAPLLEGLFIHVSKPVHKLVGDGDQEAASAEFAREASAGSRHYHLEEVYICGCVGAEKGKRFARLALEQAVNLQLLTLSFKSGGQPREGVDVSTDELLKQLTAGISTSASIVIK